MRLDVVSIFPEYLAPARLSLVGKAIEKGLVEVAVHDLRQWARDRHRTVDDTPYGGGPGMVMKPDPWGAALDALVPPASGEAARLGTRLIMLTPSGRQFTQAVADELATEQHLVLACGRYEGIDARVAEHAASRMRVDEISIGDYVLNGGEAAALVIIEAVVRLIPGVIGNPASLAEESHSAGHGGLLEYPVYTKPPTWRGLDVPEVLFSGHHGRIAAWRREQALATTQERRPDLLPRPASAQTAQLVVDRAEIVDAGQLLTLQRAAFVSEGRLNSSWDIAPLTESLNELAASLDDNVVLTARLADRLTGSVRARLHDDGCWWISRLMVAPDLIGQGIARRLMEEIEALAPATVEQYCLIAGARSEGAIAFYRHRGYVESAQEVDPSGVAVVRMTKQRLRRT
ncbi:MAG TPA: tRNA (guanosine(37)-N1)-methyltransferase TrmD [Propionibacteriaceae bacterium]|nr:tRNA (guanosine(37)-N1)-methyltransferase TrmD [Propionibacteriaceae bacterium]